MRIFREIIECWFAWMLLYYTKIGAGFKILLIFIVLQKLKSNSVTKSIGIKNVTILDPSSFQILVEYSVFPKIVIEQCGARKMHFLNACLLQQTSMFYYVSSLHINQSTLLTERFCLRIILVGILYSIDHLSGLWRGCAFQTNILNGFQISARCHAKQTTADNNETRSVLQLTNKQQNVHSILFEFCDHSLLFHHSPLSSSMHIHCSSDRDRVLYPEFCYYLFFIFFFFCFNILFLFINENVWSLPSAFCFCQILHI